jgi:hypothetical protein
MEHALKIFPVFCSAIGLKNTRKGSWGEYDIKNGKTRPGCNSR